jgi:hypothetical protein
MDASPLRSVVVLRCALALVALSLAAAASAESSLSPPVAIQPFAIPFSIDRRFAHELRPSLEEAARKLGDSRCQEILTDFADLSGRRLDVGLAAIGQTVPSYLGYVLFICWDQFAARQRASNGYAANILIHETLHTLGLGENPPDARQITAQVIARCGR